MTTPPARIPIALTIAGSDSSGGAGIQADLKAFSAFGVYGASVITALTAQNTRGVSAVEAISPGFIVAQMEAVLSDLDVGAIKTGMLANAAIVEAVAARLASAPPLPVVVDPVMVATTGALLLEKDAVEAIRKWLLPRATLVTPNAPEAATLLGWTIRESSQLPSAARVLVEDMDVRAVLVKGGDLPGAELLDVFYDGERIELFRSSRIETTSTHGSGCALSSAIAAHVARGSEILDAVRKAREWVRRGIREAPPLGRGRGPLDLFG